MNNLLNSTPKPGSNAAFIGAVSMLSLVGYVLSDDLYVKAGSFAATITGLLTGCLISNTQFGQTPVADTFGALFHSAPKSGSNAAFVGAAAILPLIGYVASDDPYVDMGSLAATGSLLLTGYLISNTQFGQTPFVNNFDTLTNQFHYP